MLVGTYLPRHDGLATFAGDLDQALSLQPDVQAKVVAIDPQGETCHYEPRVIARIQQRDRESYLDAARVIDRLRPDIVSLQHEFGLWGIWDDELDDDFAVPFVEAVSHGDHPIPVVSTLHTIHPSPSGPERDVLRGLVQHSAATVVMARAGAMVLIDDYKVSPATIVRIPHGVPVVKREPRRYFKRRLGVAGRTVISTLGLLDPRKGIEYAIAAMQSVVEKHPEALYLIVGETHPTYRKRLGEQYRNELQALVRDLNLTGHVRFVNQYLSDRAFVDYLQASDIYLTPYLDRDQITSGTLAFAVGAGKAIISTPYIHATEALAEGRGLLAEFRSAESIAHCLLRMLDDPEFRQEMERWTAEYGEQDAWPTVGARYADLFRRLATGQSFADLLAIEPDPLTV